MSSCTYPVTALPDTTLTVLEVTFVMMGWVVVKSAKAAPANAPVPALV